MRLLSIAIALLLLTFVCPVLRTEATAVGPAAQPPNIVLIIIDTLRADHLSFYGGLATNTPTLSALAARSALFANAFAASSWTPPATASLHTGLLPFQHGVLSGFHVFREQQKGPTASIMINAIPQEVQTLAELLKEQGYRTFAVTDNINICKAEGFHQGFDRFVNNDYKTAERVNQYVREWADDILSGGKFFLYLHYNDPHHPLNGHFPWYKKSDNSRKNLVSQYDSEIEYVDRKIAEVFRLLRLGDDTLIIFASDHGEEFWDHGGLGHGYNLYNEVLHVPFVFSFPPPDKISGIINHRITTMDLLPTIRDYLGLPANDGLAGRSLLPLLRREAGITDDRYLIAHLKRKTDGTGAKTSRSVIHAQWKWQDLKGEQTFVHDIIADPKEAAPLSGPVADEIGRRLADHYAQTETGSGKASAVSVEQTIDAETMESLEALGYVE